MPSYYAVIPASVRYDSNISDGAKLLYGEITALCNQRGYCWASNNYLAELYTVSHRTIQRRIAELVENGYIESTVIRAGTNEVEERKICLVSIESPRDNSVESPRDNSVESPRDNSVESPPDNNVIYNTTLLNTTVLNKDSDTNVSGEAAVLRPSDDPAEDLLTATWRLSVRLLKDCGSQESLARSMVGKWIKAHGVHKLAEALDLAIKTKTGDPIPFIQKILNKKGGKDEGKNATAARKWKEYEEAND